MPVPKGVSSSRFHSLVNALIRDKGMEKTQAEAAARKYFTTGGGSKRKKKKKK